MQMIKPLVFRSLSTRLLYPRRSPYVAKKYAPAVGVRLALPSFMSHSPKLKRQVALPLQSLCENPSLRVIPGSRRRRGISHCLENTQSEIPLRRLTDRNDSIGRPITQILQAPLHSCDFSPVTHRDQALPLKARDSPRSPGRRCSR
jgi:hypothetical protein